MAGIMMLPVELWKDILSILIKDAFLPRKNATLFEDMDVFSHPCKIFHYMVTMKTILRLVCRLWNDILRQPHFRVSYVDTSRVIDQILALRENLSSVPNNIAIVNQLDSSGTSAGRVELIPDWWLYCCQWPCLPATIGDVPSSIDLEALNISLTTFRSMYLPGWTTRLSHLHLRSVFDSGDVYSLDLPQVVYFRLSLNLQWASSRVTFVYPLDVKIPSLTTLYIEGVVWEAYEEDLNKMIFSAKATLVNLLISQYSVAAFPWEKLDQFPQLTTFGFDSSRLILPLHTMFSMNPLSSATSLSFLMLRIDSHYRDTLLHPSNIAINYLVDMLLRPGKWVGKIIVPFVWREIEPLWVNAYLVKQGPGQDLDPLPCCWTCLEYLDSHGIPIEDQNGVSLREGDGASFARQMKAFEHKVGTLSDLPPEY
ncbi:hypothetical protein FRC17_003626 [Serendipita sp. 399]|nr:hypothetical protein FRC17_003626 [Serendipita sp. 399]